MLVYFEILLVSFFFSLSYGTLDSTRYIEFHYYNWFCRTCGTHSNKATASFNWLFCLIITIDKTRSNLSNHDLIFFFFLFIQQKRVGWVQESKLMGDSYRDAASLWVCNSVLHLFFQYHSHFTQTNAYWNSQCHSILQSMYTSRLLEKTQIIARPTQLQLLNLQYNVCLVHSIQYWNHQFQI